MHDRSPSAAPLEASVTRVLYRNSQGTFAVVDLQLDDRTIVRAKGPIAALEPGDDVEVEGRFVVDARWGRELHVSRATPRVPTSRQGLARMLAHLGVRGVGAATAERVIVALGDNPLTTLRDNPEAIRAVHGMGGKRGEALVAAVRGRLGTLEQSAALHTLGLGPALIARLQGRWGAETWARLRQNPYQAIGAVRGIGFRTADTIAASLGGDALAPARLSAGLHTAIEELARHGHTAPTQEAVLGRACALLDLELSSIEPALARAVRTGELRACRVRGEDTDRVTTPQLDRDERDLARHLERIAGGVASGSTEDAAAGDARIAMASAALGIELAGRQRDAVRDALREGLHVVTGGPGTGKTTIVRGLLASLPAGTRVLLAAPTGRAARRLGESTGQAALTLHRLLGAMGASGRWEHHEDNPLQADVIIVDEASMVDVPLAAALVRAVPTGARLVWIGDADQLPSVGPGAVLDDLLRAPHIGRTRLDRVYRQGERSGIVDAAFAVLGGDLPVGSRDEHGDFFVLLRPDGEAVATTIEEVAARRLPAGIGLDPRTEIAVLVPMHRGACGTRALNERLAACLNPKAGRDRGGDAGSKSGREAPWAAGDPQFGLPGLQESVGPDVPRARLMPGDKVLQTRNNYTLDIFNGDIGVVLARGGGGARVRFGDRDVDLEVEDLHDIEPAWAMTIHKAQGSELPAVVVGLDDSHHVLLERNLLYTALTRARRVAVVVATPSALRRAVENSAPRRRATLLGALLCCDVASGDAEPKATDTAP